MPLADIWGGDVRISVIVPTYNEGKFVEKCLSSLKRQRFEDFELVVVDGHSTDETVSIAKKYADKILFDEGKGAGAARNLAVKQVDSDIVGFVDADTVVCGDWLKIVDEDFRKHNLVGLGGVIRALNGNLIDKIVFKIGSDIAYKTTQHFGFYQLSGANSAFLRSAYLKSGGYNEKLKMLDDLEFGLRMREYGKLMVDSRLVAYGSPRRMRQKGHARTFLKYVKAYIQLFSKKEVKMEYLREIEK